MLRAVLLLLCVHQVSLSCVIDNRSDQILWEEELHKDVLCNYHEFEPPSNVTDVKLRFILKSFSFDSREEKFTMNTWMFVSWSDPRLKWNSSNYEGIDLLFFDLWSIWIPEIAHSDPTISEDVDVSFFHEPKCQVHSIGKVLCVTRLTSSVLCKTTLRNWPYDTQNCTFKISSNADKIKLSFMGSRGISMLGAEYGVGWDIIDYKQDVNKSSEADLSMTFLLERHAKSIVAISIFPSKAVAILTLITMFLKIDNTRITLLCFSLYLHYYVLTSTIDLPHHGVDAPSLLYFIRGSMFITFLLLALTFILRKLQINENPPSLWLVNMDDYVLKSYLRFAIWPKWKLETVKKLTENQLNSLNQWNDFTNITNSVCIIIIPLTYIIMYIMYIPRRTLSIVSFDMDEN